MYYGTYGRASVKYRVLDKAATEFGGRTMLLDCDSTIEYKQFDDNSNVWANSEIKGWLNGYQFYESALVFTPQEKAAIAASTKTNAASADGNGWRGELGYAPLAGEHIFLLDAVEATRSSYGYTNNIVDSNRVKSGSSNSWWLRSPRSGYSHFAGYVGDSGDFSHDLVDIGGCSVSPAFNLNLESVIFSSVISGTAGGAGAEYKLTIADDNMNITPGTITRDGTTITVPYTITGTNADRVSVLITDRPYSAGTVVTSGYTYLKLSGDTSGSGTFTLPDAYADRTCGTDYYAYILAEDVNTGNATDYASTPATITIPDLPQDATPAAGTKDKPKPDPKEDDDDYDDEPAPSNNNNTKVPDGCDELRQSLSSVIATAAVSGKTQTVYWNKGTSLPYDVMKMLHDNPNVTLVFSYTYLGQNYTVTIPGSAAIANPAVPWYSPIYLYALYGNTKISALTTNTKATTGNYTVKSGDTLSAIAKRLKTPVKHLKDVNNIKNVDRIKPGMVLKY